MTFGPIQLAEVHMTDNEGFVLGLTVFLLTRAVTVNLQWL